MTYSIKQPRPTTGFHGDRYLLDLVNYLLGKVSVFIETGTNVAATLEYVAKRYPDTKCFSCEPAKRPFQLAKKYTKNLSNVILTNESSQQFFARIEKDLCAKPTLFWLDAHGRGFKWPLLEEVRFITNNFTKGLVLIDDFKVPHIKKFKFDKHEGQVCSFAYIKNSINSKLKFDLYYPNYRERTSTFHDLTGWGLLLFGFDIDLCTKFDFIVKQ
jgi:hypothetical protein